MFGFGRPSNEKAIINAFAAQIQAIGLDPRAATSAATKLVDDVLEQLRPRGIDPFKATQGNEYAIREDFTAPRVAAGLKISDIKTHWNRPILVVLVEIKVRELIAFAVINVAEQRGQDLAQASSNYKKTFVRYGDPARWDPNEKFNQDLRVEDADLYTEFAGRVDAWRNKTDQAKVDQLIEAHGTLNAAVRALVATGAL